MESFEEQVIRLQSYFSVIMRYLGPKLSEDAELGLTGPQFFILHLLAKKEKFMVTEIANEMRVAPSAITAMIERLYKNGLVIRERDEADRRVVFIKLTETGYEVQKRAEEKRNQIIAEFLSHLNQEEFQALVHLYEKMSLLVRELDNRD